MITTRHKEKSLSVLRDELDEWVSKYVRLNASNSEGLISCISCDKEIYWKDADCCHYQDRDHMGTRFYLPNLAAGCKDCNRFNKEFHIEEWEKKLTKLQIDDLNYRSRSLMKWTKYELTEMIEDYKTKVSELKKAKGL